MPGMTSGLRTDDPVLVAAFRAALLHQGVVVLAIILALVLVHGILRFRRAANPRPPGPGEPPARGLLRVTFGVLWLVDGVLQAQPQMAAGLPSEVVQPAAAASPAWVRDVVNFGGTIWSYHPAQAAASAVWIQAGLGVWLLAARSGFWSRFAGVASAAWGLTVWVFGEAFGAIFAPGLTWLSGAPGAAFLYVVAGVLLVAPARAWTGPGSRLGRLLLAGTGVFWAAMAVLQAWPGRGSWTGGPDGALAGMIGDMAGLPQPAPQEAVIRASARLAAAFPVAVNLVAVAALAVAGGAFAWGRPRVLRVAVPAATAFCLMVWVFVQDLGMPGGLGTDPNSMIPWLALIWAGYLALRQTQPQPRTQPRDTERISVPPARTHFPLPGPRSLASAGALGVVLVGAAPMGLASLNRTADPVLARAVTGGAVPASRPAPGFRLTSQDGRPVSLASLRGKVTMLTFLDPACTAACPVATELRDASVQLGPAASRVELVAIAANPLRYGVADVRALMRSDGLTAVPNWLFLTGPLPVLRDTWGAYGVRVAHMDNGPAVMSDTVFVIDPSGRIRLTVRDDPGAGTPATRASFATLLADSARQVLSSRG